ncbi:MAG: RNA polymerase sigma factor [Caldilineaceae bacterium]|nr:RNA polymerase sigma factor [Caldilineaceae bacterium]
MNETDLIARARRGEQAAWLTLVRQHQEALFRMAYLLLGDADEAEDVAQEAFIRAYGALDSVKAGHPLRPWLLQIAKNLAHNRRRSARRYLAALQRWWTTQPPPATSTSPNSADAELLWRAIRRLSVADQEILYLRYFLEMPVAETAAVLAVAKGTVKSRLARALVRLRNVIEAEFPELREEAVP